MRSKKKASRSHQQTARTLQQFHSTFYAQAFNKSLVTFDEFAASVKGRGDVLADGAIETKPVRIGDRAVVADARAVIGTERAIRNTGGRERCMVILRTPAQRTECVEFEMTRDSIEASTLKARG